MLSKPKTSSNSACAFANPCSNFLTPKSYKAEINLPYDFNPIQFYEKSVIGKFREYFVRGESHWNPSQVIILAVYPGFVILADKVS
tara:strand:+ start:12314 stop:12571 length:258 start_codon:yes stop_codon:yes gene_type:complete